MRRYLFLSLRAQIRAGRALYFLTVLGVALGVASVVCIQIINRNSLAAFRGSIQAVSGDADFTILSRTPTLPETLYPKALGTPGVVAAWPLCRLDVALPDSGDVFLEVLGIDFFAPVRMPWEGERGEDWEVLAQPGWVAVGPKLAKEMGWVVGDRFEVSSGSRRVQLVVGALVDFQRLTPFASGKLAVMDISQVQSLLARPGEIDQIDVSLHPDTNLPEVVVDLQDRLGPSVRILTPEQRESAASDLLEAFRLNLTALSLISLFVGLFLVYSSTQALLVRRRAEFGVLRSLGATRAQLLGLILREVLLIGMLGVALGIPLGYWAAQANVEVVSATLSNLYLLEEIESLEIPFWIYLLAGMIGIGGAVAGALIPALDMSRRQIRALLMPPVLHQKVGSLALPLFLGGAVILVLSGSWYQLYGWTWKPSGFVLGIAVLLAIPLSTPLFVRGITTSVRAGRFGLGYSLKSLGARLQTTSFAVSSLAVAVSMLMGITLMVGSFRRTVEVWVGVTVKADIYVSTPSFRGRGNQATLDDHLVSSISNLPGIGAVDRLRKLEVYSGDREIYLAGVDMSLVGGEGRFPLLHGDPLQAWPLLRQGKAVLIGETLAHKANLGVGDRLAVSTPGGEVRFPIVGVYYDYSPGKGLAVVDFEALGQHLGPGPAHSLALYLQAPEETDRVVDQLKLHYAETPLRFRSNRNLRQRVLKIFDQTFAITRLLQAMCLLIAVCGITLTLLILARERISELALYRALGALRRQIFWVFVGKGLGIGLLGLALGLLGGVALAAILIFVINRAYFGWTIQVYWPWASLIRQAATILGAALLASFYPALRASQSPATVLSRDDL